MTRWTCQVNVNSDAIKFPTDHDGSEPTQNTVGWSSWINSWLTILLDAPGTAGPDSIELIKVGTDSQEKVPTSTSSLINEASKMVGLPMSSPGNKATDVKAEKADDK